jgi:hypothetical protein
VINWSADVGGLEFEQHKDSDYLGSPDGFRIPHHNYTQANLFDPKIHYF